MSRGLPGIFFAAALVIAGVALLWSRPAALHEDEAVYAAWALAVRGDWWLSQTPIDKPPLFFYPLAVSLALFGPTEAAARLPNLLATAAAACFVFRLVDLRRGQAVAAGAALLFLAAPLTQAYAASAFTDPLMLALVLAAAERAQAGRARAGGVLLGLALLTKPTALFLAPFVLALLCGDWRLEIGETFRSPISRLHALFFFLALAAVLLLAWAWDAARLVPSWWLLGARAYGSLGRPEVALGDWTRWLLLGLGPLVVAGGTHFGSASHLHLDLSEVVLWATLALFLPLHLLLGFQPWDRYLLPLAALLAVGAGWRLARPARAALLAALLALPLTVWTAAGGTGLGGRDGRWEGIAVLGEAVRALPPEATVLYTDAGRPLAFYAHGSRATLRWAPDVSALRAVAAGAAGPIFVAARASALPPACRPPAPAVASAQAAFVLAAVEGDCRAALLQ